MIRFEPVSPPCPTTQQIVVTLLVCVPSIQPSLSTFHTHSRNMHSATALYFTSRHKQSCTRT